MERSKSQFARLMALDAEIRAGHHPNCLSFAADWEVSQKTVQRDIDYLRDMLKAPLEYDRGHKGFRYTDSSWFLPSVSMTEGDLVALLLGARALEAYRGTPVAKDLERVFGKLAGHLPDKLLIKPELIFTHFSFTSPPSKPVDPDIWSTMVRGVLNQRSMEITYRPHGSVAPKARIIDPYHIANLAGEWYVFAWCHKAEDVIQFAIPRIGKAELLDSGFEVRKDFDLKQRLSTTFGRYAAQDHVKTVRLLFDSEVAEWITEKQWHPHQVVRRRRSGAIELSFETPGLYEVFRWVMAWGHHARVLAPSELASMVRDEVRMMAKQSQQTACKGGPRYGL